MTMAFSKLFVSRIQVNDDMPKDRYYSSLPVVRSLMGDSLEITNPVTFLVGENGAGKSTLIEALAISMGFNPEGGARSYSFSTADSHSDLHEYLRVSKGITTGTGGFFLRAESFYNAAAYLDDLGLSYYPSYGGQPLLRQSHGESFMAIVENRFEDEGLYILDEPESALSPNRLLNLMANMHELVGTGSQFIISTHSPILMSYPGAEVFSISGDGISSVPYTQTDHYLLTKQIINNPDRVFQVLFDES